MSWFMGLRERIREALHPGHADRDLDDELRDHLAREVDRQSIPDVPTGEARRRAALRAGSLQAAKEAMRDERTGHVLRDFAADLRIAARMARRNPGFTATVVISLALGVGGTTAVFSVVNAVLVRPLPYAEADRLFMTRVWWNAFSASLSRADLLALQEQGAGIATVGAYFTPEDDAFAMATPDGPTLVTGAVITADLPHVLGARPILGAGFSTGSSGSTGQDALEALIGEALWRDRYAGSPDVIGQSIRLNSQPFTIVGVMPTGFNVPGQRQGAVWQRAIVRPPTRRGAFYLNTIVRLAGDVTPEAAASKLTAAVTPVLRDKYAVKPGWRYGLRPLKETLVGDVRRTLLLLFGAMALVLLIAIVNVMNLFLARGTVRARELAVRSSLGASRGRLARQLLAESALLGSVGGAAGLGLAWTLLHVAGASTTLAVRATRGSPARRTARAVRLDMRHRRRSGRRHVACPSAAVDAAGERASRRRAQRQRRLAARTHTPDARRCGDRAHGHGAERSGPADQKPAATAGDRPRLPAGRRRDVPPEPA